MRTGGISVLLILGSATSARSLLLRPLVTRQAPPLARRVGLPTTARSARRRGGEFRKESKGGSSDAAVVNNTADHSIKRVSDLGLKELSTDDLLSRETQADGLVVAQEVLQFKFAPAMTVSKFETMQKKRVTVTIQYAGFAGYKLYCDATERLIKEHFPDVIINRVVLPVVGPRSEGTFDILVDDLPVYSKRRDRSSVYLQLEVLRDAVRKKRKERRQGKGVYGDVSTYETVTPDHHQHIRTSAGARAAGGV